MEISFTKLVEINPSGEISPADEIGRNWLHEICGNVLFIIITNLIYKYEIRRF